MAGAGQYEDAFRPQRLQNWSVALPGPQRPSPRVGSTRIIADDRGHLLPSVSRSQASPWGTFVGTWEMPARIPPARLDLSSRSATAAAQLTRWVRQPSALTHARNGLRTHITGKPQEPHSDAQTTKEPSGRSIPASSEGLPRDGAMPAEPTDPGAGAVAPVVPDPGCTEHRLEEKASPEPPASAQPHCHSNTGTEQRGDSGSPRTPQTPGSICPVSGEASAPPAIPLPAPDPSPRHGASRLGASATGERARNTPQPRDGSALSSLSRKASRDSQKPPSQGEEGKAAEKP